MSTTDIDVEQLDTTRTLRDAAQQHLRHTTSVGEALYHQASAKASALAILAEFPDAAFLDLEPSDQEGCTFSPGAILAADGSVIADDAWGVHPDDADRWNRVMDHHYGPLTDLPDEYDYDRATRRAVPPYPWLLTVADGNTERIGRLALHAAAAIDLSGAVAAAFPDPPMTVLDGTTRTVNSATALTDTQVAALAMDAVVLPSAVIDTGARHHVELPPWPADLPALEVTGGRLPDGATYLTVVAGDVDVLTVVGVWNGERYAEEYRWHDVGGLSLAQLDQVEGWALAAWVRLADALDRVVDHAVGTSIGPVLARVTTDTPTPSVAVLNDLAARGVHIPAPLPEVRPSSPSLVDLTHGMRLGARTTLDRLGLPGLPGFAGISLRKTSENAFTVDAVIRFTATHLNTLLAAATGLDAEFASWWVADHRDELLSHLARHYEARFMPSLADDTAVQVRFTVPGVPANAPGLAVADHVYADPNVRAFLNAHHDGRLWTALAEETGLPVISPTPALEHDSAVVDLAPVTPHGPPYLSGPSA